MSRNPLTPLEESYKLIAPPDDLSSEEKEAWEYFVSILKNGTRYKKSLADAELIRQFVQHKVMRDRAWQEWNKSRNDISALLPVFVPMEQLRRLL